MKGVYVIPNFFSEERCKDCCLIITSNKASESSIKNRPDLIKQFKDDILSKIKNPIIGVNDKEYVVYDVMDYITLGNQRTNIGKHKDEAKAFNNLWKLTIYVNKLSSGGGTIFYDENNKEFLVEHKIGSAILFDMSVYHCGQPFPKSENKFAIGFRLLVK